MSYRLGIRPAALADIRETAAWYEQRERGLGERFTREVVAAVDRLSTNPFSHRLRHRRLGARWCFPTSFPYRIVYCIKGQEVVVLAVIHAARHDREWKERFRG